ncbi:IclR family transcriptional regulator [Leucobacter allii]|uniref:IclR family transcriptional regulator n=1 Tax=Leucobacter allii TaxID=2932247 RepID=A0ABY4FNJ0_9MICO|nr:IclR family transcriptional regulator [Leucobacter allii]UOQ57853.1 IclR family transcriptional regulator [Leucobacter allii]
MSAVKPNKVLANATAVIDLLSREGALSPAEIATATGIARSSVYRLVDALVSIRLVEPAAAAAGSRVRLHRRWLRLADAAALGLTEWSGAQGVLEEVAHDTGLTAYLTVPDGDMATCVAWARGSGIDLLELRPGRSLPLNAGAAGRCFLAFNGPLADRVFEHGDWPVFTDRTLADTASLRIDAETNRARGYVLSDEDVTVGVGALGVPLMRDGQLVGCLSVGGLAEAIRGEQESLARRVARAADRLLG